MPIVPGFYTGGVVLKGPTGNGSANQALLSNGDGTTAWGSAGVTDHGALTGLSDDDHSQYVFNSPAATARNLITSQGAAVIPLSIQAHASQSANLTEWKNSAGTILTKVTAAGNFDFTQNNANIAFTGNSSTISWAGFGVFAGISGHLVFSNDGSTRFWSAAAATGDGTYDYALRLRSTVGLSWSSGSSPITSTEDLILLRSAAATLQMGFTSATPVSQIFKGPGGSGTNIAGGNLTLAPGQSTGSATAATVKIQSTVAGSSGSAAQTLYDYMVIGEANTIWKNSGGTTLSSVDSNGAFRATGSSSYFLSAWHGSWFAKQADPQCYIVSTNSGHVGLEIRGAVSQTENLLELTNSSGTALLYVNSAGHLRGADGFVNISDDIQLASSGAIRATYFEDLSNSVAYITTSLDSTHAWGLFNRTSSKVALTIQGAASQSANLLELQNSAGTVLSFVTAAGRIDAAELRSNYLYINTVGQSGVFVGLGTSGVVFSENGGTYYFALLKATANATYATSTRLKSDHALSWSSGSNPATTAEDVGFHRSAANTVQLSDLQSTLGAAHLQFTDGGNVIAGTSTGSKIGTSTSQKLSLWNATPIIQPASANQAALSLDTDVTGADTVDKAAINTNFSAIQTLVNQLRTDLVAVGVIKGAA